MLEVKDMAVRYGELTILERVSFSVAPGDWLMIVGPNGAGKSTLLGAVSQAIPYEGKALFEGKDVARMKPALRARSMGMLAQSHAVAYSFSVGEIVRLGRYAYAPGVFSPRAGGDEVRVRDALEMTGMTGLIDQSVLTLSGGELQRAFLAQLFAQDPRLLLLDEPTNHLDLVYQQQVFALIGEWLRGAERAVVSVVHDLSLARMYGTRALLLDRGRIVSIGGTREVLARENLEKVYSMDVYGWMRELLSQWEE
ncbi:MAG TPA: ABC transporter ATP-binding protein [Clostridia bacterium]|nr:ABC transporter ATP-binding protein [Clostridia bacterium]